MKWPSRVSLVAGLVLLGVVGILASGALAENIDPLNVGDQYAYGENTGWINAEPANCGNCGMQVNDTSVTGYMWGENIGWVNLNCSNDSSCGGAAGNWGVTNDNAGNLKGYAWSENAGWVNFSCQNNGTCGGTGNYGVHINPVTGVFSGRAWSANKGWITFAATSPVAYQVKTSWTQTVFVVNTNDDVDNGSCNITHCSLREAINAANAASGANTITFNIPGGGVHTITPASALPAISDPVTIDGTTQPGHTTFPLIELNGTSAGASVDGLTITTSGTTVKGLVINRFSRNGISISGASATGNFVLGNYIGTNAAGTSAAGNTSSGVLIDASASTNTIGGTTTAARNVISGNGAGVTVTGGAATNIIEGNYIGTNAAGTALAGGGNGLAGVLVSSGAASNTIGGTVGTTPGGPCTGACNVISGNGGVGFGVGVAISTSTTLVQGNYIGLDASGAALGNGFTGVVVSSGTGNSILSNGISNNGGLGIDLNGDGVTPNDLGDADTGPNNLQNFPVLEIADTSGGSTKVVGTLNSTASTDFTIEFFSSPTCDPSGYGEGQVFLGSLSPVTTDASGNASFTQTGLGPVTPGQVVTATATRRAAPLDTSEFSACRTVTNDDADGDGVPNESDNCPNWYNPTQVLPPWTVPAGDSDCDGFPDSVAIGPPNALASEAFMGTDPARHCAATPARNDEKGVPAAWPVDFDDNQMANGQDLVLFAPVFGAISPNPKYNPRFDLNEDGRINGPDLLKFAPFFGKRCAQWLTVNLVCSPTSDPGKFNLQIDGATPATGANVACGGSTGIVNVSIGAHTVSETAGTGTNLANYTTVIGGNCGGTGAITMAVGDAKTCTITNTHN